MPKVACAGASRDYQIVIFDLSYAKTSGTSPNCAGGSVYGADFAKKHAQVSLFGFELTDRRGNLVGERTEVAT